MVPTIRLLSAFASLSAITSCNRAPGPINSPANASYADGFEVVVFDMRDGVLSNARSLVLKDAEQAIASGSQAFIPNDPSDVQRQLSTSGRGDSTVQISVQPLAGTMEKVRTSFHGSSRTYVYEYVVEDAKVHPTASEYRDLSRSKTVRYASE